MASCTMPSNSDTGGFQELGGHHSAPDDLTFPENAICQYQLQNSRARSTFCGGVGRGILFLRDLE